MKFKISYSVEIFEFQYKIENHTVDEGYCSGSEMVKQEKCKFCEKIFSSEDMKRHLFSCERRTEQLGRQADGQGEAISSAKSSFPTSHSPPRVKMKTCYSDDREILQAKLPPDNSYQEQLQFKIHNYILDFKDPLPISLPAKNRVTEDKYNRVTSTLEDSNTEDKYNSHQHSNGQIQPEGQIKRRERVLIFVVTRSTQSSCF